MDQTVMSFAGTAARGSAIPSPVEGMYTHLEDADSLQFWNGSSWNGVGGMTLIRTETVAPGTGNVSLNNVFSSQFRNYRIDLNITGGGTYSAQMRLRSGTDNTSSVYDYQLIITAGTGINVSRDQNNNVWRIGGVTTAASTITIDLFEPFVARHTTGYLRNGYFSNFEYEQAAIRHKADTSFDGFTILPGGSTFSGTISVYGLR
jgi:hypothetical protein